MKLPDFVGIGALKAGSTYLDAALRLHPGLCLPPFVKEVQFFDKHFDRGAEWYADHFADSAGRPAGEISPQYLFDAACPDRIHALVPNAKLLVSVRNPVDRVYSQFKHWVVETGYRGSFTDFLVEHPDAIARSRYFELLSRYLDRFDREQLHVVVFEEMVDQPAPVLREVFAYLGVPDHDVERGLAPTNVSAVPRFAPAYQAAKRVSRWVYDRGGERWVATIKKLPIDRVFRRAANADTFPPLDEPAARRVMDECADDAGELSTLVGRDMVAYWGLSVRS